MELTEKMGLTGFDVLWQDESGAWRGEGGSRRKKCNSRDQKDRGWCILNRAGECKMEIPDDPKNDFSDTLLGVPLICMLKYLTGIVVICGLAGCTATLPRSQRVSHDPLLARQGGVLLLVDACVQRDTFGSAADYFVIDEAEAGAQVALGFLHKYIQDSGIPVRAEIISVCGARLNTNKGSIRVADSVGGRVRDAQQPLRISATVKNDPEYVKALGLVSTYAFERAAVKRVTQKTSVGIYDFQAAAQVIKHRTQASSVLFLGVLGTGQYGAKKAAQIVGGIGAGYYLIFMRGLGVGGMMMEGALIDIESGHLTWSNAVRAFGDPIHHKVWANPETLDLLFRDIMFRPAAVQPPPSSNP